MWPVSQLTGYGHPPVEHVSNATRISLNWWKMVKDNSKLGNILVFAYHAYHWIADAKMVSMAWSAKLGSWGNPRTGVIHVWYVLCVLMFRTKLTKSHKIVYTQVHLHTHIYTSIHINAHGYARCGIAGWHRFQGSLFIYPDSEPWLVKTQFVGCTVALLRS